MKERTIKVGTLARVEGEGSLHVKVKGSRVEEVRLSIYEPPRFFEAFLRGKSFLDVPDIVARICGICPVAYQMSSVHAFESAFGASPGSEVRELRRLLYCGEWIESHALHVFMLHAPDFLGYPDALQMAKDHKALVTMGLRLKKTGNELLRVLGGREIHPVSVRVGGFTKAPSAAELTRLEPEVAWARDAALKTLEWSATIAMPRFDVDYNFVALRHPDEYPFNEGRIVSSRGLDIPASDFGRRFKEIQVPHSNALHCLLDGKDYLVGPLARFNLNFERLPESVKQACRKIGLEPPVRNPFRSLGVRAAELLFASEEALRIIRGYRPPKKAWVEPSPKETEGHACTEAPRGLLYHRYKTAKDGTVLEAQIVPPTSQNQARIESDLKELVPSLLKLKKEAFTLRCEQAVRNYDPCISCATHFLDVTVDEAP